MNKVNGNYFLSSKHHIRQYHDIGFVKGKKNRDGYTPPRIKYHLDMVISYFLRYKAP